MVPEPVFTAMYLSALAQIECCEVTAVDGRLELYARYEPSMALAESFVHARRLIAGAIGWAVPLERPKRVQRGSASLVQWRTRGWGTRGALGLS
ncbi:MAG: hypothetical protein M3O50_08465 [Myxococcota bacterium]|nr:hypothetical protein [Myxococcota bacterium]